MSKFRGVKTNNAKISAKKDIREFGFRVPILAKSDKTIVDGHLRLKAAKKLGLEEVPVLLCDDMTDIQVRAFRLSVNKVSEFADWDDEMLRVELDALGVDGFDLELTGFSLDEVSKLFDESKGISIEEDLDSNAIDQIIVKFDPDKRIDVINAVSNAIKEIHGASVWADE